MEIDGDPERVRQDAQVRLLGEEALVVRQAGAHRVGHAAQCHHHERREEEDAEKDDRRQDEERPAADDQAALATRPSVRLCDREVRHHSGAGIDELLADYWAFQAWYAASISA